MKNFLLGLLCAATFANATIAVDVAGSARATITNNRFGDGNSGGSKAIAAVGTCFCIITGNSAPGWSYNVSGATTVFANNN